MSSGLISEQKKIVPHSWSIKTLGELAEYINGRAFKPHEWEIKGLPIIRIQNLTNSSETVNYYSKNYDNKYLIENGDLLLAWSATLDIFEWNGGKALLNQHIFKIITNEKIITKKFFYYLLKNLIKIIKSETHGSGMVHITKPKLLSIKVRIPSISEQQKIVDKLDKKMVQIENMKNDTDKQMEFSKELFWSYLKNLFENDYLKEKPKMELKALTTKIGSGVTPRGGHSVYQKNGISFIRSMNVHLNEFKKEGLAYISTDIDKSMGNSRVLEEDVLLNITGASIGRVCVVPKEILPANVNQHVSIIRPNEKINSYYLSYYLSNPNFQKFIMRNESGATRQALTKAKIENFFIPLPDIETQIKIVNKLNEKREICIDILNHLKIKLSALNQLPASIINAVFDQYKIFDEV